MEKLLYGGKPIYLWSESSQVEPQAMLQLGRISRLPIIGPHIAVMPDVHLGKGATVGSVIPTKSAICPASVGVDIGCGMAAVRTSLTANDLPESLHEIRDAIEKVVPVGFDQHNTVSAGVVAESLNKLAIGFYSIIHKNPSIIGRRSKYQWELQMGTLGGGNHFIEMCLDENNCVWLMLHSGSRGIGNAIGQYFISEARKYIVSKGITLEDMDLAWLDDNTELFSDYWNALSWAQEYAKYNREVMMHNIIVAVRKEIPKPFSIEGEVISCHHNYVSKENFSNDTFYVTRKGAICADSGIMGIIPGSMGTSSYIVRGKGNPDSFNSCSHGAGRVMSRNQARKSFNATHIAEQLKGVECRMDNGIIDELPGAYKDIDVVMGHQQDLVDVVAKLKQVVCVKG